MANEYADLFKQPGTKKRLLVSFPALSIILQNEDIVEESMEISESICSEAELCFGACESSIFKLRIIGNLIPLIGETCIVSMYVGDIAEPYVLGTYKVVSDQPTANRKYRDITAYDAMYDIIKADVADWYNALLPTTESTVTLKDFRASFAAHFGIEEEDAVLANDSMVITRTIEPAELDGKTVLSSICELNGCFPHISRDGKLKYIVLSEPVVELFPANDLYPSDDLFPRVEDTAEKLYLSRYISCQYEDYNTKRITKLQIRQEENDIGCIIGEAGNCYIVEDNFLVYGKNASELEVITQNLFDVISVAYYRPLSVQAIGNPCLEVGEIIRVVTQQGEFKTYILERYLKGIQGLFDTYEAKGHEIYSDVNPLQRQITQLKGKTNELTRTVDETKSRIEDVNEGLSSEITQTAKSIRAEVEDVNEGLSSYIKINSDAIVAEVKRATDAENDLSASIKLNADEINLRVTSAEAQSMIDVSIAGIKLSASQISLEGYTTINGNFSIDEYGNATLTGDYGYTVKMAQQALVVAQDASVTGTAYTASYRADRIFFNYGGSTMYTLAQVSSGGVNLGLTNRPINHLFTNYINGATPITSNNIASYIPDAPTALDDLDVDWRTSGLDGNPYYVAIKGSSGNNFLATTGWVMAYVQDALSKLSSE